jgi:hypothetical protein
MSRLLPILVLAALLAGLGVVPATAAGPVGGPVPVGGHGPDERRAATASRDLPKVTRTVRYRVESRGRILAHRGQFRAQVQETLTDHRGWRAGGVRFVPVRRGGSMTVVLAQASRVEGFSSACSREWSCRVGRHVVINQDRWRFASPAWNRAGLPRRDYRHMVVNHEVGHFLGLGHASCHRAGSRAPVMMQQSKGRDGCRFNPWPLPGERARVG